MAAPLYRMVKHLSVQKDITHSRVIILLNSKRHFITKNTNHRDQDKEKIINDKQGARFLTYGFVVASGLGYALYKWRSEIFRSLDNYGSILPTIYAKTFLTTDVSQNRDRYNFIADVVEISAPSVVYIEIKDQKRIDFFTGKPATTSNGSGFIVKEDGLILTNAHVVINKPNTLVKVNVSPIGQTRVLYTLSNKPYQLLKVRLQDGSTYTGVVEDVDMQSDLATVRINKKNLPVMKLGSSSNIRPGEFVVAIGSPLSLSNTITSGIVSSVNRASEELGLHNKNMGYIQTDAAITFGNSGGPLVNLSGEAIGINAMKVTAGISFAIPIDYAKEFLKRSELRQKNKGSVLVGMDNSLESVRRRYMGVTMLTLTPDILFELQLRNNNIPYTVRHGVLVWKVMIGSPAYVGGLQAGDIVTHVNDEPVMAATSIYKVLEKPGPLNLKVLRNGEILHVKIEPEDV